MSRDNCRSASSRGSHQSRKEPSLQETEGLRSFRSSGASRDDAHVTIIPAKLRLNIAADRLKISWKQRYQSVGPSAWGIDASGAPLKISLSKSDDPSVT